jgi:hypothetical protein
MGPESVQDGLRGHSSIAEVASNRGIGWANKIAKTAHSKTNVFERMFNRTEMTSLIIDAVEFDGGGGIVGYLSSTASKVWNIVKKFKDVILTLVDTALTVIKAGTGWIAMLALMLHHQRGLDGVIKGMPQENPP